MEISNSASSYFLKVNIRNTKISNMFKINNKDLLLLCLYCQFRESLTPSFNALVSLGTCKCLLKASGSHFETSRTAGLLLAS